jgi:hypothetical protein
MVAYVTVIGALMSGIGMSLNYIYMTFGIGGIIKTAASIICVILGGIWYSAILEEERRKDHEG